MLVGRTRKLHALLAALALANIIFGLTLAGDLRAQSKVSAMACTITTNCHCLNHFCVLGGTTHMCTTNSNCAGD